MKPCVKWRIVGTISLGVVLRIAWVAMVSPIQKSDYANYLFIARNIVQNHMVVEDDGKRALIPPGEPAFLAAGFEIFRKPHVDAAGH